MKTPAVTLLLAGLALLAGGCCKKDPPSPTPKAVETPSAKACATSTTMEECATCCTAEHNSRFMGGKCDCLQR